MAGGLTLTGIGKIAAERVRQINQEGWLAEHDDEHDSGELIRAAVCYSIFGYWRAIDPRGTDVVTGELPDEFESPDLRWPWDSEWWKPSEDPRDNLVKAGALIAAEIDRLDRRAIRHGQ